jgi:SAM-dependent methyltransferase
MLKVFASEIAGFSTVLDLGCGRGDVLEAAGVTASSKVTGVDGHDPSLIAAKSSGYSQVVNSDIMSFLASQESDSFDVVVALDVVEHFEKEEGSALIEEATRVAGRKVIFMTPNGFQYQAPAPDNPYQEHLSGWTPQEFADLGFSRLIGINGIRPLRGEYSAPRIKPMKLGLLLSGLTNSYVRSRPDKAFQFIAVKDITN